MQSPESKSRTREADSKKIEVPRRPSEKRDWFGKGGEGVKYVSKGYEGIQKLDPVERKTLATKKSYEDCNTQERTVTGQDS